MTKKYAMTHTYRHFLKKLFQQKIFIGQLLTNFYTYLTLFDNKIKK